MGMSGRRYVEKLHDRGMLAQQYLDLLRQVAEFDDVRSESPMAASRHLR
jgi:hypothetical protein